MCARVCACICGWGLSTPPDPTNCPPLELSELPLVRLDFSCNHVSRIPASYRHLRHLQTILLDNNPLQSPPAQVPWGQLQGRGAGTQGQALIWGIECTQAGGKSVQGAQKLWHGTPQHGMCPPASTPGPLLFAPLQVCLRGKFHIFKYLNIEACGKAGLDPSIRPNG